MAWRKAEEGYFADSFNRDATLNCCYTVANGASAHAEGLTSVAKGIAIDTMGDLCSYVDGSISANTASIGGYDIATRANVDCVTTNITDLVKRIEALESNLKAPQSDLRRTLKTLQYKREVE